MSSGREIPSPGGEVPSDAERRLWFDYLGRVNDRDIQSRGASGLTTWGLLVLAAGAMYECLLHVPVFVSSPDALQRSFVLFLLETDATYFSFVGSALLAIYCLPGVERRVLPEVLKRGASALRIGVLLFGVAITLAHLYFAAKLDAPTQVRWAAQGLGAWWGLNVVLEIRTWLKKRLRARTRKIPVLELQYLFAPGDPANVFIGITSLAVAALSVRACIEYLIRLQKDSFGWLEPLRAASYLLALVAIVWVLLFRALASISKGIYSNLERDIVLEDLTPGEIRSKFIEQALGQDVAEWLKTLDKTARESEEKMKEVLGSLESRCKEIEQVDGQYQLERSGRAQRALQDARTTIEQQIAVHRAVLFQIREFTKMNPTPREAQLLERTITHLQARLDDLEAKAHSAGEWLAKLEGLARPPSDDAASKPRRLLHT